MIQVDTNDPREQRKFGLVMAVAFVLLGTLRAGIHWLGSGAWSWPVILYGIAVVFAVTGLALPRLLGPVFKGWLAFSLALNWVMTRVFLALAFYLLLTPVRVLLAFKGEDELKRAWRRGLESYWEEAEPLPEDIRRYRQQF